MTTAVGAMGFPVQQIRERHYDPQQEESATAQNSQPVTVVEVVGLTPREKIDGLINEKDKRLRHSRFMLVPSANSNFKIVEGAVRREDYSFQLPNGVADSTITASEIVRRRLESVMDGKQLRLLDIGTGSGSVPAALERQFSGRLNAYGLDVRPPADLPKERQIVRNIEMGNLAECLPDSCGFDIIVANNVFFNLVDPLRALERVYALLSPEGELWIDQIICNFTKLQSLFAFLVENGYTVECASKRSFKDAFGSQIVHNHIKGLVLKKTRDMLVLPFRLNDSPYEAWGSAVYASGT